MVWISIGYPNYDKDLVCKIRGKAK